MSMPIYDLGCYDYDECISVTHKIKDFKAMIFEEMIAVKAHSPLYKKQRD